MILVRSRVALALVAAATLVTGASAQSGSTQPGAAQPASGGQPKPTPTPPAPTPPPAAAQPEMPPPPAAIPVPNMPTINRQELEGGLIVEDMKIGDGPELKATDTLCFHYHGVLNATGVKFESSYDSGQPAVYPLADLVPGWQKGIPGMKVGGVRRLTVPSALGYAERGSVDGSIPPNSDLIFIIEIVSAMQYEDTKVGEGDAAAGTFIAVTSHRILDEKGVEVEKFDAAKPYVWLPGEYAPMDYALVGMKPGGKRKITVPKEINMAPPQANRPTPLNAPVTIEVEMIALRNVGPRRR